MPEICRFYGIVIYLLLKLWEKASKGEKIEKIEPLK